MTYSIKDILKIEVAPALGCTEPAAVALCAAAAAHLLYDKDFTEIEVSVDSNIFKNGMAVSIPGAGGDKGIALAAALGAFGGDASLKLEVLDPVDDGIAEAARKFILEEKLKLNLLKEKDHLYILVKVTAGDDVAEAVIEELHDSITSLKINGKEVKGNRLMATGSSKKDHLREVEEWLGGRTLIELVALLDELDEDDFSFLEEGIQYNMKLAEYGLRFGPGLGIGKTYERLVVEGILKKDMTLQAKILTSAASDARMSGVKLPAMSSAGSGNHGLTALLPIWAVKDYLSGVEREQVLKALALSHIITASIKAHTGRLSAVCGCSVAAGAGAAGGVAYMMGGTVGHISSAIKNLISDLAGVICDGAKDSCSLKLSTAAGTAIQSALFSLHGIDVKATDGIIADSTEATIRNVGELSVRGMIETDRTILDIMVEKNFNHA